jgi:hypothetical protein
MFAQTTLPVSPALLGLLAAVLVLAVAAGSAGRDGVLPERLTPQLSGLSLPLSFEQNSGQADESVAFIARSGGFDLFITRQGPVFALGSVEGPTSVRMELVGGEADPVISPGEKLPGIVNYFIGDDPDKWRTGIPTYGQVTYQGVYPGIDLVLYGDEGQVRYDFIVAPGADPSPIKMSFGGADGMSIGSQGELRLSVSDGELIQPAPFIYQERHGLRQQVAGAFAISGDNVTFDIGTYDRDLPLVIDPAVVFSSFLGGSGTDTGNGIDVGDDGSIYVTGDTDSMNFPVTPGVVQDDLTGGLFQTDAFVTKISPDGDAIVYSTYLGGQGTDRGYDVAVDADGVVTVGGLASEGFPTTPGAFDASTQNAGFVSRLSDDGSELVYSTGLGTNTAVYGLEIDDDGNAYIAGFSLQAFFQATPGSFQPNQNSGGDGIVGVLNPDGTGLVWGSYIGGSDREFALDIARDGQGNVIVVGGTPSDDFPVVNAFQDTKGDAPDAFVAKIVPDGSALSYSTYLGGDGSGLSDRAFGVDVDSAGNAYVVGRTTSNDFPVSANRVQDYGGNQDAFVTKFGTNGNMVYSTYLGGGNVEDGAAIEVDDDGNAHVVGSTGSVDFPTEDATQSSSGGGQDGFVATINTAGSALLFSTYLGGSSTDVIGFRVADEDGDPLALDDDGNLYITGRTSSSNFPVLNALQETNAGEEDAFVVKLGEGTLFGDIDCGGSVDPIDALKLLRYDAGLNVEQPELCLNIGDMAEIGGFEFIWGDIDCSGAVDPIDALKVLRFDAGLNVAQEEDCPALGILLA